MVPDKDYDLVQRYRINPWRCMVPDTDYDPILKTGDTWYQTRITTLSKDIESTWYQVRVTTLSKDIDPKIFKIEPVILIPLSFMAHLRVHHYTQSSAVIPRIYRVCALSIPFFLPNGISKSAPSVRPDSSS